ncbi:transcription factor Adf-1-like [Musca domestica]|uniref:Transcription factor Adf-1-like n=2 Tax=Musca domestica TaxID=7370 RepID=A0A9J7IDK3_MUSDO|nr:transcription factor Adf-1-like [Musca domestica]XP_019892338.2 transcription factor Adf-1-like [Musca domestica]XP_019892339.2 transcription factor Adf-1-like [Musca domestica]
MFLCPQRNVHTIFLECRKLGEDMTANHRPLDEIDISLIEFIKLSPCLYNNRHPDFRSVHKKNLQWSRVGTNIGMSPQEARKRWTALRRRYARELKQVNHNPTDKSYGQSDFFCRMDFLRHFIKKRPVRNDVVDRTTTSLCSADTENMEMKPEIYIVDDEDDYSEDSGLRATETEIRCPSHREEDNATHCSEMENNVGDEHFSETSEKVMEAQDASCTSSTANIPCIAETDLTGNTPQAMYPKEQHFSATPDIPANAEMASEDSFSKVIASYLKNLSLRYKIKAQVEMMQVLEKYIDKEESERLS